MLLAGCGFDSRDSALYDLNQGRTGFKTHKTTASSDISAYSIFIPHDYNPTRKYPTIVFLHGMGEAGRDGTANLRAGLGPIVADQQFRFNYICVFPQSASGKWTVDDAEAVLKVLDEVRRQYRVDDSRVYLSGFSAGGYGVWAIGAKYPERFAALVPVSGFAAEQADTQRLAHFRMPIWAFHNAGDPIVASENTRRSVTAVNAAGGIAKYTVYNDNSHNAWQHVFTEPKLFAWLDQQSRRTASVAYDIPQPTTFRPLKNTPY